MLGDLNQDLVQSAPRDYGSCNNRTVLGNLLEEAGLHALTAADGDPIRRDSSPCAAIDHICAREVEALLVLQRLFYATVIAAGVICFRL